MTDSRFLFLLLGVVLPTAGVHAQLLGQHDLEEFLYEAPPRPTRPDAPTLTDLQRQWIDTWTAKVYALGLDWDDNGRITTIRFSNHGVYRKDQPEKPGTDDDDMQGLLAFPHLTDVGWECQRVGNRGVAMLKNFPEIQEVRFHYMAKMIPEDQRENVISPDFMLVVDGFQKLRVLEYKHLFALNGTRIDKFKHPLPTLEYMELDCESAGPPALHLIALAPKLRGLELHRTTLTDEEFGKLVELAPGLEYLEIKPKFHREGYITGESLRYVAGLKQLKVLRLSHNGWKPLAYQNGLEHLVNHPALKTVLLPKSAVTQNDRAALQQARPDLDLR